MFGTRRGIPLPGPLRPPSAILWPGSCRGWHILGAFCHLRSAPTVERAPLPPARVSVLLWIPLEAYYSYYAYYYYYYACDSYDAYDSYAYATY